MKNGLGLFLMFSLVLILSSCNGQKKSPDYSKALLVDVRTPEEFAAGTVPGAVNIPVDEIENRLNEFKSAGEIVVFCRSGSRSARAKSILNQHGLNNVTNGGTWQQVNAVVNSKK